jgi:hypothetical protein
MLTGPTVASAPAAVVLALVVLVGLVALAGTSGA